MRSDQLQLLLDRAAGPGVPLTARPMFGGIGCYADGRIFAIIWSGFVSLKLLGDDFTSFAAAGGLPVQFMADKPASKTYIRVPDAMLGNAAMLAEWTGRAVRAALAAEPKKPKPRRRRRV